MQQSHKMEGASSACPFDVIREAIMDRVAKENSDAIEADCMKLAGLIVDFLRDNCDKVAKMIREVEALILPLNIVTNIPSEQFMHISTSELLGNIERMVEAATGIRVYVHMSHVQNVTCAIMIQEPRH